MVKKVPRVVPWKSEQELNDLKEEFYNGDKKRALSITRMFESRGGALPPSIEATSLLMSAMLTDSSENDSFTIRCAYSMALVRFVNGQLDQYQRSQMAIPLHKLAQLSGLPSFFVELRHGATHEGLSTLEFLREAAARALDWLWERYWSVNQYYDDEDEQNEKFKDQVKESFREWRRLRRSDPVRTFKRGDTTADGLEFWGLVKKFENYKEQDEALLMDVMYRQNVLIPGKDGAKVQPAIKLFGPLIQVLNESDSEGGSFVQRLAQCGLSILDSQAAPQSTSKKAASTATSQQQHSPIITWLKHFVDKRWLNRDEFTSACLEKPREWNVDLLKFLDSPNLKVRQLTEDMEHQFSAEKVEKKRKLEDIEVEMQETRKRVLGDSTTSSSDLRESSLSNGSSDSSSSWTVVTDWTPRPIGVL